MKCRDARSIVSLCMISIILALAVSVNVPTVFAQGGLVWTEPLELSAGVEGRHLRPVIAADPFGGVHVVWTQELWSPQGFAETSVFYAYSNGAAWAPAVDVFIGGSIAPQVVADDSGYVHLVWSTAATILHSKRHVSQPVGASSWSRPTEITTGYCTDLHLVLDEKQQLHLAYKKPGIERGVYYQRSADGGDSWSDPLLVSEPTTETKPVGPTSFYIFLYPDPDGTLHVVWQDDFSQEPGIYCSRSSDNGVSWLAPYKLDGGAWATIVKDRDGYLHVLYHGGSEASCARREQLSTDGGTTWTPRGRILAPLEGCLGWMHMAADSAGTLFVVAIARTNQGDVGFWQSTWLNGAWGPPQRFLPAIQVMDGPEWNKQGPDQSRLAVGLGNQLHLAWFTNDGRIWYSSSHTAAPHVEARPLPALPTPPKPADIFSDNSIVRQTSTPSGPVQPFVAGIEQTAEPRAFSQSSALIAGILPALAIVLGAVAIRLRRRR